MRLRRLRAVMGVLLTVVAAVAVAAEPSLEVHLDPRVFGIEDAARLMIRILEPSGTPGLPSLPRTLRVCTSAEYPGAPAGVPTRNERVVDTSGMPTSNGRPGGGDVGWG